MSTFRCIPRVYGLHPFLLRGLLPSGVKLLNDRDQGVRVSSHRRRELKGVLRTGRGSAHAVAFNGHVTQRVQGCRTVNHQRPTNTITMLNGL